MNLLLLALRNLRRSLRRTLITGLGIALGLALMFVSNNVAGGQYDDMISQGIATLAGHAVVQAEGYQKEPEPDRLVLRSAEVEAALEAAFPEGVVTRRVFLGGLITSPHSARAVQLMGIEPDDEARITDLREQVVAGEWLGDDDRALLVGEVLARSLDVDLGARVVVMTQVQGEMSSRMFRVRGLLKGLSPEQDAARAYAILPAAQALLPGDDPAHQVSVHLARATDSPAAAARARSVLPAPELEVLSWEQALPEIAEGIRMDAQISNIMWGLMGIIVAMGVLNTVLTSTLERTREFGVMMAVGMRPGRLARLVLVEALVLGLVASVLGVALGALMTWPLAVWGIDMSGSMGESYDFEGVQISTMLYATWDWSRNLVFAVVAVLLTVLAAIGPAWRVTHLTPVEAMRHK